MTILPNPIIVIFIFSNTISQKSFYIYIYQAILCLKEFISCSNCSYQAISLVMNTSK